MMLAIGSDHGGFELKEEIKKYLENKGIAFEDFGSHSPEPIDYPIIAKAVGEAVASGQFERGLLFCGTGVGISMAANKIKGIRAACCDDCFSMRHTRLHNDANILCLGGRVIGSGLARDLVDIFLDTGFEGGKHARRVGLIAELEREG